MLILCKWWTINRCQDSLLKILDTLNVQVGFMLLKLSSLYFTEIWILEAVFALENSSCV